LRECRKCSEGGNFRLKAMAFVPDTFSCIALRKYSEVVVGPHEAKG